jgi:hypothetical protein
MLFIPMDVLNPKEVAKSSLVDHKLPYCRFTWFENSTKGFGEDAGHNIVHQRCLRCYRQAGDQWPLTDPEEHRRIILVRARVHPLVQARIPPPSLKPRHWRGSYSLHCRP